MYFYSSLPNGFQAEFKEASDEIERLEREISDLGNIDHLNDSSKQLQDKMRANKTTLNQFRVRFSTVDALPN